MKVKSNSTILCYTPAVLSDVVTELCAGEVGGDAVSDVISVQEKYVEMFQVSEVMQHFGLSREKLVLLAMLTGSDYTDGVEGVGPVTALEVLAEFPGDGIDPLLEFKMWWTRVHKVRSSSYRDSSKITIP